MSSETRKRRRKRHHVKQHHSNTRRTAAALVDEDVRDSRRRLGRPDGRFLGEGVRRHDARAERNRMGAAVVRKPPAGDQPVQRFDIPAGPLSTVLPLFERTTGIAVALAADSIGLITSPGVVGTYSPQDALARLLEGTSVVFRFVSAERRHARIQAGGRVGGRERAARQPSPCRRRNTPSRSATCRRPSR